MKSFVPKQIKADERIWYFIDAKWLTLWRLSTRIATTLRWKNKLDFSPHVDNWDYVIVTNSDKFKVTWKKITDKVYYKHSGYLWWLKETPLNKLLEKKPMKALEKAVKWMLPKNKLKTAMISRLKLFIWDEHTFTSQKPKELKL